MLKKLKSKNIIVAVSGYFAPLHSGHIEYIKLARKLGDYLVVILNNDKQGRLKKKKFYELKRAKNNTGVA